MARKRPPMTEEQKAAIVEGRRQHTIIRRYLTTLNEKGRSGRRVTPESLRRRLDQLTAKIESETDPAKLVELISRKHEVEARLVKAENSSDRRQLEEEFIKVAAAYSARKGISRKAWREVGVPADVLNRANIRD